ncbi:MAG: Tn3 family transposase [Boseongicola sp.]|nr:Tn3 family transposase [Boseongicola sp.]
MFRASNGHDQGRAKALARSSCQRRQFRQGTRRRRAPSIVHGLLEVDIKLRAGLGLNKGEAHHALKNPPRIGCLGMIRDRTPGARHFRIAGINLRAVIIICWNTEELGHAVREREFAGLDTPPDLPVHDRRSAEPTSCSRANAGGAELHPETHGAHSRTEPGSTRDWPQESRTGAESPGKKTRDRSART